MYVSTWRNGSDPSGDASINFVSPDNDYPSARSRKATFTPLLVLRKAEELSCFGTGYTEECNVSPPALERDQQ